MTLKRDISFTVLGVSLAELIHKVTGKTLLENITDPFTQKKRDALINNLINESEGLSPDETKIIIEAMHIKAVFNIISGIEKPEENIIKDILDKAELRLKEIAEKDADTYLSINLMKTAHTFGVSRINKLNSFLSENSAEDIIHIHNLLKSKYPNKYGKEKYEKFMIAFNFQPTEEDEIEFIAYEIEKLLRKESIDVSAAQMHIMVEVNETFGKEVFDDYMGFLKYLLKKNSSEHKNFLKFMRKKYSADPEKTLNLINDVMKEKSNSVRKKYFEIS